jgi:hypothetical protein
LIQKECWELVVSMGFHSGIMSRRLRNEGTLRTVATDDPICLHLGLVQFAALFETRTQAEETLRRVGVPGMAWRLRQVSYTALLRSRGTLDWVPSHLDLDDPRVELLRKEAADG